MLAISTRRLLVALLAADLSLVLLSAAAAGGLIPSWRLARLLDVDAEATVLTWYASAKYLFLVLMFAAAAARRRTMVFALAAAAFLIMSLDETAAVHEEITAIARQLVGGGTSGDAASDEGRAIGSLLVAIPALLVVAALVAMLIRNLPGRGSAGFWFGTGFALLGLGAVGIDIGRYAIERGSQAQWLASFAEETCEMIGLSLMSYGAARLICGTVIVLRLEGDTQAPPPNPGG